jgi:hypothetical protein
MINTYAKIKGNIVDNLILSTPEDIVNLEGNFVQCYEDESFRYNYPQIGGIYDEVNDAFINIQPFENWVLNNETFKWEAPIAKPEGPHFWFNGNWQPITAE